MTKPVVIVAADGAKLNTEADLFAKLDQDEEFLLKKHPLIDDDIWRDLVAPQNVQDKLAVTTIDRLRALRDALQKRDTPAWQVAALAISYQNMVMIYWEPVVQTKVDSVNASRRARTRAAKYAELASLAIKLFQEQGWDSMRAASKSPDLQNPINSLADELGLPHPDETTIERNWLPKHVTYKT